MTERHKNVEECSPSARPSPAVLTAAAWLPASHGSRAMCRVQLHLTEVKVFHPHLHLFLLFVVVSSLIYLNPRAQNVSRPWREPQRRYKEMVHGRTDANMEPCFYIVTRAGNPSWLQARAVGSWNALHLCLVTDSCAHFPLFVFWIWDVPQVKPGWSCE